MIEITQSQRSTTLLKRGSKAIALLVILLGCFVLVGWMFEIEAIKGGFLGNAAAMKVNTAIGFILSGSSLWLLQTQPGTLWSRFAAQAIAIIVALIGLLTSTQYLFGWDLGIDQLVFHDTSPSAGKFPPGRMGFNTSASFAFMGGALWSSRQQCHSYRVAQILTLFVGIVAFQTLVGYAYQVPLFQGLTTYTPQMPLPTALTFIMLCGAVLSENPEQGVMRFFASTNPNYIITRRLILAAISIPLILGWVILTAQRSGYLDAEFALTLLIIQIIIAFAILILLNIVVVERMSTKQQAALRESDERLSLALDAAKLGSWDWNLVCGTVTWSAQHERLFGMACGSFNGTYQGFLDRIYPGDREGVIETIERVWVNQEEYSQEFRILLADKSIRWIATKGQFVYDENGRAIRMTGVCMDITATKQLQQEEKQLLELEQAARAKSETANRMKDEFLCILSHELRTPLNSILGWSKLLRTRSLEPTKVTYGLETIERNAKAQFQIVDDLLDVSRIIQAKLLLDIHEINLISVIDAAIATMHPASVAKNIKIETVYSPCVSTIMADFTRLQQVVWNLLSNAIKFTPSGGYVKVSLEQVGSSVHIYISDTGKGISAQFIPYVFDRFSQEDRSLTRAYGGLGLGLAIVRSLVELHGGTVDVKSAGEGLGARFLVKLPIKPAVEITKNIELQSDSDSDDCLRC
ncbi:MAG: HAMP domain-containing histidine kinase [Cyanomargarita calcarea GSE-NOS-MK-12-04C]|jgi:PAS domain S-box-containing protein|uniref:histidine kinase n=1 Tax=Cyanomargarita calcarea GSE-NOS-MK-12-04C TaxID=2839659 RepID=A0A951QHS2_9CYAN|nr:HAMP domain-containing histidine kinase [Cyanomargarita calcarea GSE-NOS-MK-12-04C]